MEDFFKFLEVAFLDEPPEIQDPLPRVNGLYLRRRPTDERVIMAVPGESSDEGPDLRKQAEAIMGGHAAASP
ncbi:MAG: hypothetical protein WCL47_11245, partial [Holophagaceae bacterium]